MAAGAYPARVTLGRFLVGIPLSVMAVGCVGAAAVAVRRRLVPTWRGPDAVLVDAVLTLSALTILAEVLGTFGLLRLRPFVVSCVGVGALVWWVGRGAGTGSATESRFGEEGPASSEPARPSAPSAPFSRWSLVAAGGAVTLFVGSWMSRTLTAMDQGVTTVDSHWYHLPFAVNFLQTGRTSTIHVTDEVTAYFPATSSLFHMFGMMFFRTDLLSTVLNLAWLALALLAAWCIGRPFGVAPVTVLGPAILLGGPGMVETQPGGALTDVVGCALFLAAVAIALVPRDERTLAPDVLAAMAAGLSTGAKFTFLPAAGALCIGLAVLSPPGQRIRRTISLVGGAALTGGYWYVRNLVAVGNPLPSLDVGLGPFRLPHVEGPIPGTTVLAFLGEESQRSAFLVSGLRDALGPVWPVVLLLALAGTVLAIARPDPRLRMLGVVAMTSHVAYLLTPQFVLGGTFFATNFRYAAPGVILGLILFALVLHRFRSWTLPLYAGVLVLTQLDPVSWPFGFGGQTFFEAVDASAARRGAVAAALVAVAVGAVVVVRPRLSGARLTPSVLALGLPTLLLLGLAAVHGRYVDGRYRGPMPFPELTEFSLGVQNADIAVYGPYIYLKSPFVGADLSNRVQYLYVDEGGGELRSPATCEEWVGLLEQGAYDYVFVVGRPAEPGPIQWTDSQPDARLMASDVFPEGDARAYRLDPSARRSCGRPAQ